ncbi:hypothetical protein FRC01_005302 [Tulasnella sp. 417]|nr:hypothetical protein FRC01_005302 [Tulasnella sp. 417]
MPLLAPPVSPPFPRAQHDLQGYRTFFRFSTLISYFFCIPTYGGFKTRNSNGGTPCWSFDTEVQEFQNVTEILQRPGIRDVTSPPPKLLGSPVSPLEAVHDANAALQDIVSAMLTRSESENSLDVLSQFSSPSTAPSLSPEVHAASFLDPVNWAYLSSSPPVSGENMLVRSKRINSMMSGATMVSSGSSESTIWDSSSPPAAAKSSQLDPSLEINVESFEKEVATAFRLPQTPQPPPRAQFTNLQPPPSTPPQRPRTADHTTLLALSTRRKQAGEAVARPATLSSPPRERTWRHGTVIAKNMMSTDELGRPKLDDELNRRNEVPGYIAAKSGAIARLNDYTPR